MKSCPSNATSLKVGLNFAFGYLQFSYELSRDVDGHVTVRIARFIRSEEFVMNQKSKTDAFRLFKNTPDLTTYPPIIPLSSFDEEKHKKLCMDARGTVPTEGVQKLIDLPQFLQNLPKPETFEVLLNRFRSKVAEPIADVLLPQDLENENLKEFMARMF
uniref:Uncharacterized protein n=1 Tax=Panagrolaimus superbus TaxID=310955 RepID=A0A914XWI9_9BILA